MPSFTDALCERTSDGLTVQALWDGFRAAVSVSRGGESRRVDVDSSELLTAFYHPCCGRFLSDADIDALFPRRLRDDEQEYADFEEYGGETPADWQGDTLTEGDGC